MTGVERGVRLPGRARRRAFFGSVALVLSAIGVAGCSLSSATKPTTSSGFTIKVHHVASFGDILTTGDGFTLYDFVLDTARSSACVSAACMTAWPPLLANGPVRLGPGLKRALVSEIRRSDGTMQIAYGGHPLYTFVTDTSPGDMNGQAFNNFGGPWYVITPAGTEIRRP